MSAVGGFSSVWAEIRAVRAEMQASLPAFRWATVTSVDPLRVTPDGDTSPLAEAPDTLVGGLVVGDRVRLVIVARRALILGRAGGKLVADWYTDANPGTVAAGGDVSVAVLNISLPRAARLQVTATQRMRSNANSAGYIDLNVDGTRTKSARWHNNGQIQDQFPLLLTTLTLPAGDHSLGMRVRCDAASTGNAGIAQGWMEIHTI